MEDALKNIPQTNHKDDKLLVGFDTNDDCAVYKVSDKEAIVETIDFFPSMINDPYVFGQIAAANALSDIFAMGAKAVLALNMVCFPSDMDGKILGEILRGGQEKIEEAGAILCGGHSISDDTVKYGLAVTGIVDIDKILKNNSGNVGDLLILTKPLGVGILVTANNNDIIKDNDYDIMVKSMTTLNKTASEILREYNITAMTDVTGFGLLNHLKEMLTDDKSCELYIDKIPLISNNLSYYVEEEMITGAAARNKKAIEEYLRINCNVPKHIMEALYDPQTSGGLLCAINPKEASKAIEALYEEGIEASIVAKIIDKKDYKIIIKNYEE